MLTSDQVVDAIVNYGRPGGRGRARALDRINRTGMGTSTMTTAQRALVESIATAQVTAPAAGYAHPAAEARTHRSPAPPGSESQAAPLTAAAVAFLQRLPEEPDKIPYDDAVEVFKMANGNVAPQDAPLVRAVADPLRSFHDRRAADAQLAAAQEPPLRVPASALNALADAIAAENEQLHPAEALGRANDKIAELSRRRLQAHEERVEAARQRIAQLDADDARRTAVTR